MDASSVAVIPSTLVAGGEVQVAEQIAETPPKRRRLSSKGPSPSLLPPSPPPQPVALPVVPQLHPSQWWNDVDEASLKRSAIGAGIV